MKEKVREKERAIFLRRKGFSYTDILREIPVAKSTLSHWLKDFPLTKTEKKYVRARRNANISNGRIKAAAALHARRLEREAILFGETKAEFTHFAGDPLFHIGVALYWAEGAKRSDMFQFMNSDPQMIALMLVWIEKFLGVPRGDVCPRLYIHKPYAHENCEQFWSEQTAIPIAQFRKTIYKPTGLLVKKRPNYKGCLRLEIPRSNALRLKTMFWSGMLAKHHE